MSFLSPNISIDVQLGQTAAMKLLWKMAVVLVLVFMMIDFVMSQPQANLINQGCSQVNASFEFFSNLNTTLANLRRQLSVNKTHFATAELARSSSPVYAIVQCRNYLSAADCVSCFDIAAVDIRKYCKLVNGARVIYDGCFLRYRKKLPAPFTKTDKQTTGIIYLFYN